MARRKRDSISEHGQTYWSTEITAEQLKITPAYLRELARGAARPGRKAHTVPCIRDSREYFFDVDQVKEALSKIRGDRRTNDKADDEDILAGI